jgi:hypothetical protein
MFEILKTKMNELAYLGQALATSGFDNNKAWQL